MMRRVPTYVSVAEQIKAQWLTAPDARQGSRLPSERELQVQLGVSRATVSKALALLGSQGLIRSRVGSGTYVDELLPTQTAPSAGLIGFVAPFVPSPGAPRSNPVERLYHGMQRRAPELGFSVMTAGANLSVQREEELVEQFVRLGAAGIVLYPIDYPGGHRLRDAGGDYPARRWRDTPIVLVDNGVEGWRRPIVQFDNYLLGYEMTRLLLQHGRRSILFMHTAPERLHNSLHDRQKGWVAALARAGMAPPPAYLGWPSSLHDFGVPEPIRIEAVAHSLLSLEPRPDAVIAWEDVTAVQVIQALQNLGVAVPQDICVTGFDNADIARYFQPAFPTTTPDFECMGELAIDLLARMVAGEADVARTYVLPAQVLWREPAPAAAAAAGAMAGRSVE